MAHVVIVGCGVVGATIAYELSQHPNLTITVLDKQLPAQGATGAALGILMGVISHKVKGRNWRLREASLRRYATLLPELDAILKSPVPHNPHGIVRLCFSEADLPRWESLQARREQQGWPLSIWSPQEVARHCPHISVDRVVAGIYSPKDGQIAPKDLTAALVAAAQHRGVTCHFDAPVTGFTHQAQRVATVQTVQADYSADWVILASGLGSGPLIHGLAQSLPLVPVLGQGMRVRLPQAMGFADFQPVLSGDDIHVVPLGDRDYAVAATVEFPELETAAPLPQAAALEQLWQGAIAYCPLLAQATIVNTWYGLRPRPQGQAAPVVQRLAGYPNVIVATGHYRNGVLLAPATAQLVCQMLLQT